MKYNLTNRVVILINVPFRKVELDLNIEGKGGTYNLSQVVIDY